MIGRIRAIALNTFREAVRDRVLYNLVLFVLLLTAAAIFIGELSGGQERKIIVDLGLSAMLLFGVFIAIFVGVGLVYKEIERRTIYAIFSKPVGRGEFIVGKYLGLCLTLLVNVIVMATGVSLGIDVRQSWVGSIDCDYLASSPVDLCRVDDSHRCCTVVFLIFLSCSFRTANLFSCSSSATLVRI
jgi:ABC-type transport system involved in multi-copper enzyme maturation permease subunit